MKSRYLLLLVMLMAILPATSIVAQSMRFLHHLQLENGIHPDYREDNELIIRAFIPKPLKYLENVPHEALEIGGIN